MPSWACVKAVVIQKPIIFHISRTGREGFGTEGKCKGEEDLGVLHGCCDRSYLLCDYQELDRIGSESLFSCLKKKKGDRNDRKRNDDVSANCVNLVVSGRCQETTELLCRKNSTANLLAQDIQADIDASALDNT